MNIIVENCDVNIIAGTETLEISGKTHGTASARPADKGVRAVLFVLDL